MTGSLFLLAAVVLVLFAVGILASPFFFIPAAVLLVVGLVSGPIFGVIGRGRSAGGVPDTEDAAYDPVQEPQASPGR